MRKTLISLGGLLGLVYLLNPGAGIFEIIPDALPFVGNVDEALAATLVLACLREYGLDLTRWGYKPIDKSSTQSSPKPPLTKKSGDKLQDRS